MASRLEQDRLSAEWHADAGPIVAVLCPRVCERVRARCTQCSQGAEIRLVLRPLAFEVADVKLGYLEVVFGPDHPLRQPFGLGRCLDLLRVLADPGVCGSGAHGPRFVY